MLLEKNEMRGVFNRIGGALLFFLLLFNVLVGGASTVGEIFRLTNRSAATYIVTDLVTSFAYLISFTAPVWFFFKISKGKTVHAFGLSLEVNEERGALSILAIVFLGCAFCFIASYVNSLLAPISDEVSDAISTSGLNSGYKLVLMFISTAIIPAFVEELLFRGLILSQIKPYSTLGAILISAILFGLMHQTTFQFFYTTVLGVILAVVRIKTGSIWPCILVHFFNNFISVMQSYFLDVLDEQTGYTVYMIIMLLVVIAGLVFGTLFYLLNAAQKGGAKIFSFGVPLSLKQESAVFYRAAISPTLIAYAAICAVTMIYTAITIGSM